MRKRPNNQTPESVADHLEFANVGPYRSHVDYECHLDDIEKNVSIHNHTIIINSNGMHPIELNKIDSEMDATVLLRNLYPLLGAGRYTLIAKAKQIIHIEMGYSISMKDITEPKIIT